MKLTPDQIKIIQQAIIQLDILATDLGRSVGTLHSVQDRIPSLILPTYLDFPNAMIIVEHIELISKTLQAELNRQDQP